MTIKNLWHDNDVDGTDNYQPECPLEHHTRSHQRITSWLCHRSNPLRVTRNKSQLMSTLSSHIDNPRSFHPVSRISFNLLPSDTDFIKDKCSLHIYYQLPASVFIDPYELVQRREEYIFFQWGHADLEKPVHAVKESNVSFLLNVEPPQTWLDNVSGLSLDVKVPLHARYGIPSPSISPKPLTGTYHDIVLQFPKAFIACEKERPRYSPTPPLYLSEIELHEAGLESKTLTFLHLNYSSPDHVNTVRVPLGHGQDIYWVQSWTAIIVLLCFIWVTVIAVLTATRLNYVPGSLQGKFD